MKDNECQNEAEAMGSGGDDLSISEVASVKLEVFTLVEESCRS